MNEEEILKVRTRHGTRASHMMDWYTRTMEAGAAEYADAVEALRAAGHDAYFTQTGGLCAAIQVDFDGGYLLITDQEDSLSWRRAAHRGWLVGLYTDPDTTQGQRYAEAAESDVPTMLRLVAQALGDVDAGGVQHDYRRYFEREARFDASGQWCCSDTGAALSADDVQALGRDSGLRDT